MKQYKLITPDSQEMFSSLKDAKACFQLAKTKLETETETNKPKLKRSSIQLLERTREEKTQNLTPWLIYQKFENFSTPPRKHKKREVSV